MEAGGGKRKYKPMVSGAAFEIHCERELAMELRLNLRWTRKAVKGLSDLQRSIGNPISKVFGVWFWALICWGLMGFGARAQRPVSTSPSYQRYENHSRVRLLRSSAQLSPAKPIWLGLHLLLDPGWHGYWRNPGDSGAAPQLTVSWQGLTSTGATVSLSASDRQALELGAIRWPVPERINAGPLTTFGYTGEVLLARSLTLKHPLAARIQRLRVQVDAEWLVCKEECIPAFDSFSRDFVLGAAGATGRGAADVDPALFARYRQQRPPADFWQSAYRLKQGPAGKDGTPQGQIVMAVPDQGQLPQEAQILDFFPFANVYLPNQGGQIQGHDLRFPLLQKLPQTPPELAGLLLYRLPGDRSVALRAHYLRARYLPAVVPSAAERGFSGLELLFFALLAFGGGLILNLMPCVFPVLALKVLGVLRQRQELAAEQRSAAFALASWFYLAGVELCFLGLAGVLVGAKSGGALLGWGFQFSSPGVLVGLILLFFALGLHFLGLLPPLVWGFRPPMSAAVETSASRSTALWREQFFSGILAVFVASPCTAPFMGAALGFALTRSLPVILVIFAALGLGFALPYVLLLQSPQLLAKLPRPGAWMQTFQEFLFFPMLGTALWLLWVLGRVQGHNSAMLVLSALLLLSLPLWVRQRGGRLWLRLSWALSLPSALGLITWALLAPGSAIGLAPAPERSASFWTPFAPELLARQRFQQPVLVDFTADWCLTCQVNEWVTFGNAAVRQRVADAHLLMLQADWTRHDPRITQVLKAHGRISVPFYLLYRPGQEQPEILPELLTPDIFLKRTRDLLKEKNP